MAQPPLELVRIVEDPRSGREKQVFLTPEGKHFLHTMVAAGQRYLDDLVCGLSAPTIGQGIEFLSQLSAALEQPPTEACKQKQLTRRT
jgi:DNA-binding MarR family transcriptional regulator